MKRNQQLFFTSLLLALFITACGPSEEEVKKQQEEYREKINAIMGPYSKRNEPPKALVDTSAQDSLKSLEINGDSVSLTQP